MLVTVNNELKNYLNNILSDVKGYQLKALIGFCEVAKCPVRWLTVNELVTDIALDRIATY